MERKVKLEIGEFYHVYNRGVEKRAIFKSPSDYKRFLALLYIANSSKPLHLKDYKSTNIIDSVFRKDRGKPLVAIGAYCLMPNHFHLLLTPLTDGGISKFMLKVQTGYSMYFNKKNDRIGSLFQGVFKSQHINKNRYLVHIYSYIHLNPAKLQNIEWKTQTKSYLKTLRKFIVSYPYSSILEYLTEDYKIIDPKPFPMSKKDICSYNSVVDHYSKEFSFVEAPPKISEETEQPITKAPEEIPPPNTLNLT